MFVFYLLAVICILALVAMMLGLAQTFSVQRSTHQKQFSKGSLPDPAPDGAFRGSEFTGLGRKWQGKVFDAKKHTGTNQFADGQRYTFKTYPAQGLRDPKLKVLKIDYNHPSNPWWLRPIVDEIVQVAPGKYLGKVHVTFTPWVVFSLTYFKLTKK